MSRLNDPENFAGRVNYAAQVIASGKGWHSRGFANCFENSDGDVVAAALMRRAETNPKIAANIFKALSEPIVRDNAAEYAGVKTRDLPEAARECRARVKARWAAADAARESTHA